MNLANYTMRCGTRSQCRHNLCDGDCGRPLRDRDHTQADPEVHAVIIVSGAYNIEWDHAYAYVSDGSGYNIVEPLNSDSRLLPEAIHNWTPAKVVADND